MFELNKVLILSHVPHFSNPCCFLWADLSSFRTLLQNLTWPFRKLSFVYRAQQLWRPCCFPSHWSHSVLSSCLSATTKPAMQFGDRGSKASYHTVHPFFVFSLILSCTPKRSVRSLPHFKNAEVFPFSFLWCILYRDCPDTIRAPPYPALVPCLIPASSTSGQKFSGFPVPPHSAFPSEEWWTSFGDEIGHTAKTRWWWGLLKLNNEKRYQCIWEVIQD